MTQPHIAAADQARAAATAPRPLLIGESNPYGADPAFALFPRPANCAGERLCRVVFGLREATYLDAFDRVNLLVGGKWSASEARTAADRLRRARDGGTLVLLGARVAAAFCIADAPEMAPPWHVYQHWIDCAAHVVYLPHPSGLCRRWHEPGIVGRCHNVLREALPGVPFGEADAP